MRRRILTANNDYFSAAYKILSYLKYFYENGEIQIPIFYGRRYLSKMRGFNTGGEISAQPTISDRDYHVSGGNAYSQGWLGSY